MCDAARVVRDINDRKCDLVVMVVDVIRVYVECCDVMRNCLWFCVQQFRWIGCGLMLMVCVVDGQRQL